MKRWIGLLWLLLAILFAGHVAFAQVREIDSTKLPQDSETQATYKQLSVYERYGQAWTNQWTYDVPKQEVVGTFTSSLRELTEAAKASPDNHELQLLAGLVAHFAYNVDVEAAYDPAMQFLHEAALSDPSDYRAKWFIGMQECQANEGEKGMPLLLSVEEDSAWQKLPIDFWNDYVTCATVTRMPAHSLRAISRAIALGAPAQSFQIMKRMNEDSFKASDLISAYPSGSVWMANGINNDVVFTSRLCGISLRAHGNWAASIYDVKNGTCAVVFQPPAYRATVGMSSPSVMMMSQPARLGETLNDFAHDFLKEKYAAAVPAAGVYCPSTTCLEYDISNKGMYANEGGAHLMMVAFERDMPEFDGLMFERPEGPPKPAEDGKMAYFTADEEYHRLPGKLYYLVLLDSNVAIFDAAKQDYDFFLKSIQVE